MERLAQNLTILVCCLGASSDAVGQDVVDICELAEDATQNGSRLVGGRTFGACQMGDPLDCETVVELVDFHSEVFGLYAVGSVAVVNDQGCTELSPFPESGYVLSFDVSPDGASFWLVTAEGDAPGAEGWVFDSSGSLVARHQWPRQGSLSWTPDGNAVMGWGCGTECAVRVTYAPSGEQLFTLSGALIDASPDGRFILVGHWPGAAELVDASGGNVLGEVSLRNAIGPRGVEWGVDSVSITFSAQDGGEELSSVIPLPGH